MQPCASVVDVGRDLHRELEAAELLGRPVLRALGRLLDQLRLVEALERELVVPELLEVELQVLVEFLAQVLVLVLRAPLEKVLLQVVLARQAVVQDRIDSLSSWYVLWSESEYHLAQSCELHACSARTTTTQK